ncbi:hypothetical protein V5F77_05185 [Xanthobacter sp. DSM 24535]|uniref:hypothetical protein n=1 Tax=Roseixanthobacter psychrophilus TaxID=3119917 RepID=UPI00372CA4DD
MNDEISLLRAEIEDLKRHVLELKEMLRPRSIPVEHFTLTSGDGAVTMRGFDISDNPPKWGMEWRCT